MAQAKSSGAKQAVGGMNKEVPRLKAAGHRVQIVGSLKNGKLQLDHAAIKELEEKWPDANIAFLAMNAPFDPMHSAELDAV